MVISIFLYYNTSRVIIHSAGRSCADHFSIDLVDLGFPFVSTRVPVSLVDTPQHMHLDHGLMV